ncbi:MAG TPA: signal peptidase I, partial [Ignavibacteria bacterium]|nr:signal peptidase I [Ignavibacteria bacterium]
MDNNNLNNRTDSENKNKDLKVADLKKKEEQVNKSKTREFIDALVYAGVVAFIIKILFFEAFRIPTGSMEKTLWVGDFLLVTKFTYGATSPRNIPFTDIRLPYFKLPAFKDPKKGDIIVFDFPGDRDDLESKEVVNYIKRCVGVSGDTIHIVNKQLYVNGEIFPNPPNSMFDNINRPQSAV